MKRILILALLILGSGCASMVEHQFGPARNETTWNSLRASLYLSTLKDKGFLPGIATNAHGRTQATFGLTAPRHVTYPWETRLMVEFDNELGASYWYLVTTSSADSDLALTRIWKTDAKGKLLGDNLPLPSSEQQRIANDELRNCDDLKKLRPEK